MMQADVMMEAENQKRPKGIAWNEITPKVLFEYKFMIVESQDTQ
jgi:hypothetical protein